MNKNAIIIYIHTRKFLIDMVKSMKEIDWMTWSFCDKENKKEGDEKEKMLIEKILLL